MYVKNYIEEEYGKEKASAHFAEFGIEHVTATHSTSGTISKVVQDKNDCRKKIQGTLNGLILLIKANYPDTYSGELRNWGFQKEKY